MNRWWLRLSCYAFPQVRGLGLILALMVLGVFLELLVPWPIKMIVDYVLLRKQIPAAAAWLETFPGADRPAGQLAWLAAATVIIFLIRRLARIVQTYVESGAGSRMSYSLATDIFDQLQHCSLQYHLRRRQGDLVSRVLLDTSCVRELVLGVYLPVLTSVVTLVGMFVVMWQLHHVLALLAISVALPLAGVIRGFARQLSERKYFQKQLQGEMLSLQEQTLTAIPIVQAFRREDEEDARFRSLSQRTVQANLQAAIVKQRFQVSAGAVTAVAMAVVLSLGGAKVLQGELTVGSLLVLLTYFAALYSPLESLAYLSDGFALAAAGARRVFELVQDSDDGVRNAAHARALPSFAPPSSAMIAVEHVTFGFESGRPVLHDVQLQLRAGEIVALVGPTGAGKSTLTSLLPRFYDPWQGRVTWNGADLRELRLDELRSQVSIVFQEPFLLPVSIADNIAYGRPQCSSAEIIAAAQAAQADAFIRRLPRGYKTVIGERGATLSGGEKQRLAIARALLKDAPLLILDEPTSALDAMTESELIETLEVLTRGRTVLLIAHRLSTIRLAHRIVLLDHGRIAEEGTHDHLYRADGAYRRLYDLQSQGVTLFRSR